MITCTFENGGKGFLRHTVVDNILVNGNSIMLVKRTKGLLEAGKWALPAGFVGRDETLHEAAKREIFEELGTE